MTILKHTFTPTIGCFTFIVLGLIAQGIAPYLSLLFYLGAILFGGYKQTREGLIELWHENTLNVDLLMALEAIGACIIGDFFEGAMLTFIFCLSGALEEYTTSKSQQATIDEATISGESVPVEKTQHD